jgi:hypothetical protein
MRVLFNNAFDAQFSPDIDSETDGYQGFVAFSTETAFVGPYGTAGIYMAPVTSDANGYILPIDPATVVELHDKETVSENSGKWSPDGSAIVSGFWDAITDEVGLAVIEIASGTATPLCVYPRNGGNGPALVGSASWASDGLFIVYQAYGDLMIVPSDGSAPPANYTRTRNVSEGHPDWNPAWNPSGDGAY